MREYLLAAVVSEYFHAKLYKRVLWRFCADPFLYRSVALVPKYGLS